MHGYVCGAAFASARVRIAPGVNDAAASAQSPSVWCDGEWCVVVAAGYDLVNANFGAALEDGC